MRGPMASSGKLLALFPICVVLARWLVDLDHADHAILGDAESLAIRSRSRRETRPNVVLSRGAPRRTGGRRRGSNVLPFLVQPIQNAPLTTVPDGFPVADHEHPHLMRDVLDVVGDAHMTHAELV